MELSKLHRTLMPHRFTSYQGHVEAPHSYVVFVRIERYIAPMWSDTEKYIRIKSGSCYE